MKKIVTFIFIVAIILVVLCLFIKKEYNNTDIKKTNKISAVTRTAVVYPLTSLEPGKTYTLIYGEKFDGNEKEVFLVRNNDGGVFMTDIMELASLKKGATFKIKVSTNFNISIEVLSKGPSTETDLVSNSAPQNLELRTNFIP